MSLEERRRRNGPQFKTHRECHEAVLANEFWFGDGAPVIGKQFTAAKAKERKAETIGLLYRTAGRERRAGDASAAEQQAIRADKIFYCQPGRRCGSLACTECQRAFQKAKVAAQETSVMKSRVSKLLIAANVTRCG